MKITVIHGSHEQKSRQRYFEIINTVKKRGWQIKQIEPKQVSALEDITGASLFEKNILYILENTQNLSTRELNWLSNKTERLDANLLLWHKGEISKRDQNKFPQITNFEKFDLPRYIFKFTESLYPGNSKTAIKLLHQTLENDPPEFVLALIANTLLDLSIVKAEGNLGYPGWREAKLKSQAKKFKNNEFKKFLKYVALIDLESKSGGLDLASGLDIAILKHLK